LINPILVLLLLHLLNVFRLRKKKTHNTSSVKSNVLDYRESEVDEDLAYKYYKKKMGIKEASDLAESSADIIQLSEGNKDNYDSDQDFDEDKGVS